MKCSQLLTIRNVRACLFSCLFCCECNFTLKTCRTVLVNPDHIQASFYTVQFELPLVKSVELLQVTNQNYLEPKELNSPFYSYECKRGCSMLFLC